MTPGKHTVTNAIGEGLFVTYEITVTAQASESKVRRRARPVPGFP